MLLGESVFLAVVVKRAYVDVCGGMAGVTLQHLHIGRNRLGVRVRIFFQSDSVGEKLGHVGFLRIGPQGHDRRARNYLLFRREVEHKLPGDGLEQLAFVAKCDPVSGEKCARLEQRVFHARHLFLHRLQRLPDHGRAHLLRAQVTDFLDLQEIETRVALRGGVPVRPFPNSPTAAP